MARDPNNIVRIDYNAIKREVLKIQNIPDFDIEDYDLNNPKDFPKYIASIEKTCRGSFEYRQYVNFLREHGDMNKCSFFKNVTNVESFKIKIHIHHEPITLFDIVIAIYNKRQAFRQSLSEEQVAKEAIYMHYKMYVGLIPLAETVHELVHNQYLFVPSTAVLGYYNKFIEIYKEFIEPETIDNIRKIEAVSAHYDFSQAEALLDTSMIFIDPSGAYTLPKYEDIINSLKDKVQELKSNRESTN